MNGISNGVSNLLIKLINFYQRRFSPDHSPMGRGRYPHGYCRFYPSCSEYALQALESRGLSGIGKIILRIIRCNPFSTPAFDPIIKHKDS